MARSASTAAADFYNGESFRYGGRAGGNTCSFIAKGSSHVLYRRHSLSNDIGGGGPIQ